MNRCLQLSILSLHPVNSSRAQGDAKEGWEKLDRTFKVIGENIVNSIEKVLASSMVKLHQADLTPMTRAMSGANAWRSWTKP